MKQVRVVVVEWFDAVDSWTRSTLVATSSSY